MKVMTDALIFDDALSRLDCVLRTCKVLEHMSPRMIRAKKMALMTMISPTGNKKPRYSASLCSQQLFGKKYIFIDSYIFFYNLVVWYAFNQP